MDQGISPFCDCGRPRSVPELFERGRQARIRTGYMVDGIAACSSHEQYEHTALYPHSLSSPETDRKARGNHGDRHALLVDVFMMTKARRVDVFVPTTASAISSSPICRFCC